MWIRFSSVPCSNAEYAATPELVKISTDTPNLTLRQAKESCKVMGVSTVFDNYQHVSVLKVYPLYVLPDCLRIINEIGSRHWWDSGA